MRKKNNKIKKLVIVIVIMAISIIGGGYYSYVRITNLETANADLNYEIESNTQTVYVAIKDITHGDMLYDSSTAPSVDDVNVEMQNVATGLEPSYYMTADMLGRQAVVDMDYGTPVMATMVSSEEGELSDDERDCEISVVQVMTDQAVADHVDVRIAYPDGSDYIVLSNKKISQIDLQNCIWHANLNEKEILYLTSATVDAYLIDGAKLYTTRYVEDTLQGSAEANYIPKESTITLLTEDPNIVNEAIDALNLAARRIRLEETLGTVTDEQKAEIEAKNEEDKTKRDTFVSDTITNEEAQAQNTGLTDTVTDTTEESEESESTKEDSSVLN